MKTILITGGAGFIGSHFVRYFLDKYPQYQIINIDLLTYAGSLKHLQCIENHPRHHFIQGDITHRPLIENLFQQYSIDGVIHFAAESHVDRSIQNPDIFVHTNIMGTQILLDTAKNTWQNAENTRFHYISTDEVYGSLGETGFFSEESPLMPNSPYSASKAAAEMLVRAYTQTFGLNTVISRSSNNYGIDQHDEKLIPTIIRHALQEKPIPIYGNGNHIRDWLYVSDHCRAIDAVFHHGKSGEVYNIGGHCEYTNNQTAQTICRLLDEKKPRPSGKYADLITSVTDRAGHDFRYALNTQKIENQLSWQPETDFIAGLNQTVDWYIPYFLD